MSVLYADDIYIYVHFNSLHDLCLDNSIGLNIYLFMYVGRMFDNVYWCTDIYNYNTCPQIINFVYVTNEHTETYGREKRNAI